MITTVLFDLGNVILPYDLPHLAERLAVYSKLKADVILSRLWNDQIASAFESGRMTPQEFYAYASKSCELSNLDFDAFVSIFNHIFTEDGRVVELIRSLKANYHLGLISNTNELHVAHIRATYRHLENFDKLFLSNELGLRKPDPRIYKLALDHFGASPEQSVFIDDMAINIQSARSLGMHGIEYKNYDLLMTELEKIGVTQTCLR